MPDDAHGCGPECEPWITATHCGVTKFDHATGGLLAVRCPSTACVDLVVPLVAGRIAPHVARTGATRSRCPWTGIRVVDDHASVQRGIVEPRPADALSSNGRRSGA